MENGLLKSLLIKTSPQKKYPSEKFLSLVKTPKAKEYIRRALRENKE